MSSESRSRRRRRSSSPGSRSRTSSGRSTSATTVDVLARRGPRVVRARGRDHDRHRRADGLRWKWLLRAQGMRRAARVADAGVLRLVHGRPDPPDLDRRRRGAGLRDVAAPYRPHGRHHGDRAARARPRRRCDGAARRDRLPARDRPLPRRRVPLDRGRVRRSARSLLCVLFFARSARPLLARVAPASARAPRRAARCGRSTRASTTSGATRACSSGCSLFTTVVQAVRVLAIWAAARAVGIELGPRIYYVMGPLFFLVLLVPFTLNGFAVREAFFVSFLGSVGVGADQAFAAGFLFFLVTVALALPGGGRAAVGGHRGGGRRARRAWLTGRRGRRRHLRRAALARAVPRERRGDRRPSSSTTARATGRPRSCASASPTSG